MPPDHSFAPTQLSARAAYLLRGNDLGVMTTAAPLLYPHMWSWDAAFVSIGLASLTVERAVVELDTLLSAQWANGMIPHIVFAMPIAILILVGFFQAIPASLEEAAVMDGCSVPMVFFRIIVPMSVPSLVTVAVITFITAWNDLLFPQIFLADPEMMTLPVGLTSFQSRYSTDYVGMIAAVVITILPTVVIYSLLHRKIISGMTAGAVKG